MSKENWVWLPHPAHFICAFDCRFRMATVVGDGRWIVSTVGEYFPDSAVRELNARLRGVDLEGRGDERQADYMRKIGYEEIGCDRKYETMVFPAQKDPANECCGWKCADHSERDGGSYNDAAAATRGHMELCAKWEEMR